LDGSSPLHGVLGLIDISDKIARLSEAEYSFVVFVRCRIVRLIAEKGFDAPRERR